MAAAPAGHFVYSDSSPVVIDTKTGLTWQRSVTATQRSWSDATNYCSSGVSSTLGGGGWRVPTIKELLSLVDYSQALAPMVDRAAFPDAPVGRYWSTTSALPCPGVSCNTSLRYVDFASGGLNTSQASALYLVRCVR